MAEAGLWWWPRVWVCRVAEMLACLLRLAEQVAPVALLSTLDRLTSARQGRSPSRWDRPTVAAAATSVPPLACHPRRREEALLCAVESPVLVSAALCRFWLLLGVMLPWPRLPPHAKVSREAAYMSLLGHRGVLRLLAQCT